MSNENHSNLLTEREAVMAFNMGLQTAIYVLESAENMSSEGRKYLVDELKKEIAGSELDYTIELIGCMSKEK